MTSFSIDAETLAELRSDHGVNAAADEIAAALEGVYDPEKLVHELLTRIFGCVPAERGAVLLAGPDARDLQRTMFRGSPFSVQRALAQKAFCERKALLHRDTLADVLCVPLCMRRSTVGALYLESSRAAVLNAVHLRLLALVAAEVAPQIDAARYANGLQGECEQYEVYVGHNHGLVGENPRLVELRAMIEKTGPTPSNVLILGEMGTGKELVARALHKVSKRKGVFMAINCAAIQPTLLESELFGYEKGAFTGANATRIGKLEAANNGTVFLDEIAEMSPEMQAKFLRVLQEREFQRVGGIETLKVDVRIIAATNRDLNKRMAQNLFLSDLYYRLNVVPLRTPALREIREDIPRLVEQFMADLRHVRVVEGITPEAMDALCQYHWPGNVRELRNVIEYALGQCDPGGTVDVDFLPDSVWDEPEENNSETLIEESTLDSAERALRRHKGNVRLAAAEIDVTTRHMRRLKQQLLQQKRR